ncbi:MAG TPA: hypothetical protein VN610_08775 [Bryobacteraceae bacterium]|nr:hypothetical protein [Bryobacteraceae bacterium]
MASLYRRSGRLCGVYRALPLNAIAKLLASRANIVSQHWKFWSIGMIAGARRIAIVATLAFIRRDDLHDAFAVTALLLAEEHDLKGRWLDAAGNGKTLDAGAARFSGATLFPRCRGQRCDTRLSGFGRHAVS